MMSFDKSIWFFLLLIGQVSFAQEVPLNQESLVKQLNQELSGESAKRNLEYISRLHRMRGSEDFNEAIDFISGKLEENDLEKIELIKIPTDGKTMYGTQKARLAWDVEFAELWELEKQGQQWVPAVKVGDWESVPLVLAQDSRSGEAKAELVDIGKGTSPEDYVNKDVKGKLVLTSSQPGAVVPLAIQQNGAVGIISYAQNQVTAWWKENENLIRWGHLDDFSEIETFAFMVSLKQARAYQQRLKSGETIMMHAKVKADLHPGNYNILTAVIEGSDSQLKNEEIVFTCHLDHPRPGANDNASGCVAILEIARTLKKLIAESKIDRPKRTIRFVWSPEIEGTTALLNYRPDLAQKAKFNIHMDMVGGGPETKAIFHVSRSPHSVPNFIDDVGEAFGEFVNVKSYKYASGEAVDYPIVSNEGGKEALHAVLGEFHMGSDFQVFSEGSFRIPSIYLHDWPDRYIHTNYDVPGNIDPTKLKRSGFIGAGSAYFLANLGSQEVPTLLDLLRRKVLKRASAMLEYCLALSPEEQENTKYYFWAYEKGVLESIKPYAELSKNDRDNYTTFLTNLQSTVGEGQPRKLSNSKASKVYVRNAAIKGPMSVFGYNYFFDHYDGERPEIYSYKGVKGSGSEYAYETLNLVNGKRTNLEIRNTLSAEFGPIPLQMVIDYLEALKSAGVIN